MMSKIVNHSRILEATERTVARSPKAEHLQDAICTAMAAYANYLREHDLVVVEDPDSGARLVSTALIAKLDFTDDSCEIVLRDGPIDRAYGDGTWPDPWGPHEPLSPR